MKCNYTYTLSQEELRAAVEEYIRNVKGDDFKKITKVSFWDNNSDYNQNCEGNVSLSHLEATVEAE